ncbi:Uncharacterized protein DBV15_11157 [Temnothorax longispinosus]|uniref:Uncharacterized protein n=1 Tax=Temnothorax longispinosus TaxID=300112 RepID=A0A4S2JMB8_9HYME|nr:Uncharacterized protein DBV15_11157 [Temnothorax longispinosus]
MRMAPLKADYQPASLRGAPIKVCARCARGRGPGENEREMRSCKLSARCKRPRDGDREPLTSEIRYRTHGAYVTKHMSRNMTRIVRRMCLILVHRERCSRVHDYVVKAIFDAAVTGQSGLHPGTAIPVPPMCINDHILSL